LFSSIQDAGSSSLKACVYALDGHPSGPAALPPLWKGRADWGRQRGQAAIRIEAGHAPPVEKQIGIASPGAAFDRVPCALSRTADPGRTATAPIPGRAPAAAADAAGREVPRRPARIAEKPAGRLFRDHPHSASPLRHA